MFERVFNKKALAYALTAAMTAATMPAMADGGFTYEKQYEKNCQMKPSEFCQKAAQTLSKRNNWLPIVAHGGNEVLFERMKRVVRRLNNEENIRAYMVHSRDRDNVLTTMTYEIFTKGGRLANGTLFDNDAQTSAEKDQGLFDLAKAAYEADYGKKVAVQTQPDRTIVMR